MPKKMQWNWEILDEFTKRVRVIGGWLIQYGSHTNKGAISDSIVFVPDRDHEWTIVALPKEQVPKQTNKSGDFEPK